VRWDGGYQGTRNAKDAKLSHFFLSSLDTISGFIFSTLTQAKSTKQASKQTHVGHAFTCLSFLFYLFMCHACFLLNRRLVEL